MDSVTDIFARTEALVGADGMVRLKETKAIVFGVGGVGSWCAEALVRSGIGQLTLVDPDVVCFSNINRQLPASTATIGRAKVEVLKERFEAINPGIQIVAMPVAFHDTNAEMFDLEQYDFIVDAIDNIDDKAHLILTATRLDASRLFSSMGAARKMRPECIKTAEFWKVEGCPLARSLRKWFKKNESYPERKFVCVYSDEVGESGATKGTMMHITAMFGLRLAALVLTAALDKQ